MKEYLILVLIFLSIFFISCSSNYTLKNDNFNEKAGIKYSIIYVIHGDGSYVYHDSLGNEINADERMLEQAKYVAQNSFSSEVFIFHIKPKKHFLFFFPLKDREYYYYNKGRLINRGSYNTVESYNCLEIESRYYKRLSQNSYMNPNSASIRSFFLYYGHQIPELGGKGYNSSYPVMSFNIDCFVAGLSQFRKSSSFKFDLVVLSTCNNGTPGVISRLSPFTRFVIASPEDLHLSYINSTLLTKLKNTEHFTLEGFVQEFAKNAFENLKNNTQTVITISVYDMEKVISFLNNNIGKYDELLLAIENQKTSIVNCTDCQKSKFLNMENAESGVSVYFRPPLFGKLKTLEKHSGWGCLQSYDSH